MREFFFDICIFIKEIALRWINLCGGAVIGTIFLWCAARRQEVPVIAWWWILGLCLAIALFQAWRDQYLKNKAGLQGEILSIALPNQPGEKTLFFLQAQITNNGEPSIVQGFKSKAILPD